jgi:hypothetical protein
LYFSLFVSSQNKPKIEEHEYYDVFNSISNPLKEPRIVLESEPYAFDLSADGEDSKIFDTLFQKTDKPFLTDQIDKARRFFWGPGMIYGSKVANKSDIIDFFRQGADAGWDRFEKTFGCQEYWVYSVPLFSADKTTCLIKYVNYCGALCKAVYLYYYKKSNDKWETVYHYRNMN